MIWMKFESVIWKCVNYNWTQPRIWHEKFHLALKITIWLKFVILQNSRIPKALKIRSWRNPFPSSLLIYYTRLETMFPCPKQKLFFLGNFELCNCISFSYLQFHKPFHSLLNCFVIRQLEIERTRFLKNMNRSMKWRDIYLFLSWKHGIH